MGVVKSGQPAKWECVCDCGNKCVVSSNNLKSGNSTSCGCYNREIRRKLLKGQTHSRLDLNGKVFGRLRVLSLYKIEKRLTYWECQCECGKKCFIKGVNLKTGTMSCGCIRRERQRQSVMTHGQTINKKITKVYSCWLSMKNRCYYEGSVQYKDYGGRGIKICEEWMDVRCGFINFYKHMGDCPSKNHTVDRFPNINGNYEPGNVRWALPYDQARSRRNNVWLEYEGEMKIIKDWANELGVCVGSIKYYLSKGKTFKWVCDYFKKIN